MASFVTYEYIHKNPTIMTYIRKADEALKELGYTEHSFAHVEMVAQKTGMILSTLGYSEREVELGKIAGIMHDIGNVINRIDHAQSGAVMAFRLLDNINMPPEEICTIISAIGNHDESTAEPISPISASLIIADKTDVRRSRVRNTDFITFDIHDRVNYAALSSSLEFKTEKKIIQMNLELDDSMCTVMDYFGIFLERMMMCRRAAEVLGWRFKLVANGSKLC